MSDAALAAAKPDDSPPLAIWIGFIAMVVGQFMAILDIQIVASALGSIQAGVSASRDEISWVQTSYLIAEVIGIPLSGFLGRALGTRLLFCISALAFSFTSLLCAFAWDINSLIIFRAMQGFSGAAMIPTVMATLYLAFPQRLQPMTGAMMGMVITLAPSLGPTIGGLVAETLGWRALFWVNVVPGILITVVIWNTMASLDKPQFNLLKKIDLIGLAGLAMFLGAAEYTLEEGPGNEWFASTATLAKKARCTRQTASEALKAVAAFRLALPRTMLRFAGGREITLGDLGAKQGILGGINAVIVGNYLTTLGRPAESDLELLDDLQMPIKALNASL